jgi:predicted transport protein
MFELTEEESLKVRDVTKIGHWGMGDIKCFVENGTELEWMESIINKSYNKIVNN